MNQLVTGYLPSVILILFLYAVPPTMMLFSTMEGNVSRSERKRSACIKVLYFTIWNVFFVNVLSGSVIRQLSVFSSVRDIPTQLAKAVPTQVIFHYSVIVGLIKPHYFGISNFMAEFCMHLDFDFILVYWRCMRYFFIWI